MSSKATRIAIEVSGTMGMTAKCGPDVLQKASLKQILMRGMFRL